MENGSTFYHFFILIELQQMRAAWTINAIPASQQASNLQHYFNTNQRPATAPQPMPQKVPEDYAANEFSVKRIYHAQNASTSYIGSKMNASNEPMQQTHHPSQIVSANRLKSFHP